MKDSKHEIAKNGDEVMKALGELKATTQEAVKTTALADVNHEEVKGWLTTIVRAIVSALKP